MLDIDTAIKHCLEVAEKNECKMTSDDGYTDVSMKRCAAEHRQLAEWLMELKDLRAEQNDQYVFIHELMSELKEAKQLLKATINDIYKECSCNTCGCDICECNRETCDYDDRFTWRHKDEALKLIGEENDEP